MEPEDKVGRINKSAFVVRLLTIPSLPCAANAESDRVDHNRLSVGPGPAGGDRAICHPIWGAKGTSNGR
jgi:hypothetical protein